jgi:hypothetical protein
MLVEISEAADFYREVYPAYDRVRATDGEDCLEIALSPGTYTGVNLSIGDGLGARPIDIVVRAADRAHPPILHDLAFSLSARSVRLDGLVFAHARMEAPVIHLVVASTLRIEHCALIDAASLAPRDGRLVELVAFGGSEPATASLSNSWFIRNWALDGGAMLACVPTPPHFFDKIEFDNVAFLENHATASIAPGVTSTVQLTNCVVGDPTEADDAAPLGAYLHLDPAHTHLRGSRNLLIAADLAHLLGAEAASHTPANGVPLIDLGDSQLMLRNSPETAHSTSTFDSHTARLAAAAEASIAAAQRGEIPDRAQLAAALLSARAD